MVTAKKSAPATSKPSAAPARKTPAGKAAPAAAKKRSATSKKGQGPQDAVALLTDDHNAVKKLFKKYDKLASTDAPDEQKQDLARMICAMLTLHATIEEEIFYPAAREVLPKPDLLDEAEVEHASAKELIAQIEASDPSDSLFDAKVHVLAEYIDHHVTEEEEEMFPKLKRAKLDMVGLGDALRRRKEELTANEGMEAQPA